MILTTHILSPDTQAILLLYGRFGRADKEGPKPLVLGEYNALAKALQQHKMRPGDLLCDAGFSWVRQAVNGGLDAERIIALLERGGLLSIKVEEWTNQGLWILSRSDEDYPQRLKRKLQHDAPPILYGVGNRALLDQGGLAVVGSREVDEEGLSYSRRICQLCAQRSVQIVSGGARGVDRESMLATIEAGGTSVGVLANDLAKESVSKKYRDGLRNQQMVLTSPFDPSARFNVGNAMARNKYVYALADHTLVVSSAYQEGGTWAGATEELNRENRSFVWVRTQGNIPEGNSHLVKLGAIPLPEKLWQQSFLDWLAPQSPLMNGKTIERQVSSQEFPKETIPGSSREGDSDTFLNGTSQDKS
jgi:predicted Rossmann fold nucleotide-binding protein DprA/Smf involved in DNA uptake